MWDGNALKKISWDENFNIEISLMWAWTPPVKQKNLCDFLLRKEYKIYMSIG